ncbi:hypothetical protein LTR46_008743 [Exophiala xenobiotica]|nr:hypothetical protein LTR46_008743 [Exophiala xenobiotica]
MQTTSPQDMRAFNCPIIEAKAGACYSTQSAEEKAMPVYLVHGFRWPREGFTGIRVHAIIHNLEDTSVEYIQNENSRSEILASFRKAYPDIMKELEGPDRGRGRKLDFIEQYNPDDLDGPTAVSQPYAFVGDKVVMIAASPGFGLGSGPGLNGSRAGAGQMPQPSRQQQQQQQYAETAAADERQAQVAATAIATSPTPTTLSPSKKAPRAATQPMSKSPPFNSPADVTALSVNVEEVLADGPGLTNKAWEALADLRDKIAEGEKIGWWVVYNGDPERSYDEADDEDEVDDEDGEEYDEEYDQEYGQKEQQQQQQIPYQQYQQQQRPQQRPVTSAGSSSGGGRPRTAPTSDSGRAAESHSQSQNHPPLPLPISATSPRISQQQQQQQSALTALPIRPNMTEQQQKEVVAVASPGKTGKGKQKDSISEPAKMKETAKSQGLRKKFFGRRA